MGNKKDNSVLYIFLGVLFIVCVICIIQKRENKSNEQYTAPPYKSSDIEFLETTSKPVESAYELLGNEYAQESFDVGFGMGPGLYGSGRHTVEMDIL
jgi:hypothetical protein